MKTELDIEEVITALRETDEYIKDIFLNGGCYQFHLFLKKLFPECTAWINLNKDHVFTHYKGSWYDITGRVSVRFTQLGTSNEFYIARRMTQKDHKESAKWSFRKMHRLKVNECPECECPITA